MNREVSKIRVKKEELDILNELLNNIESYERDSLQTWDVIGKSTEQAYHYKRDNEGNRLVDENGKYIKIYDFDDNGEPIYKDEYGYKPINVDDMNDSQYARYIAVQEIKKYLEKRI